jgi:hypothetical protein
MNKNSLKQHLVENPVTYDFTLHDGWRCVGDSLWALAISWSRLLSSCVKVALRSVVWAPQSQ